MIQHAEVAGAQLVKAVDSAASASGNGAQTLQNAIDYIGYILEVSYISVRSCINKEDCSYNLLSAFRLLPLQNEVQNNTAKQKREFRVFSAFGFCAPNVEGPRNALSSLSPPASLPPLPLPLPLSLSPPP